MEVILRLSHHQNHLDSFIILFLHFVRATFISLNLVAAIISLNLMTLYQTPYFEFYFLLRFDFASMFMHLLILRQFFQYFLLLEWTDLTHLC